MIGGDGKLRGGRAAIASKVIGDASGDVHRDTRGKPGHIKSVDTGRGGYKGPCGAAHHIDIRDVKTGNSFTKGGGHIQGGSVSGACLGRGDGDGWLVHIHHIGEGVRFTVHLIACGVTKQHAYLVGASGGDACGIALGNIGSIGKAGITGCGRGGDGIARAILPGGGKNHEGIHASGFAVSQGRISNISGVGQGGKAGIGVVRNEQLRAHVGDIAGFVGGLHTGRIAPL